MEGGGFRVLHLVRPFLGFLPEVQSSERNLSLREKIIYPVISLFIFLVCSQLPLYGRIHSMTGADQDPVYWMRLILASNRGTLMELGITPIVTSGLIMQLLTGFKIIKFDNNVREDRALLNVAQKLLGIVIAIVEAVAYVVSGMYGPVAHLGAGSAFLIISQLFFAGIIVISLDELLQKGGYGLSSRISLFIAATNLCGSITWKAASYRQNLANVTHLLVTVLIFLIVSYFMDARVVLPERSRNGRLNLLYNSNMPQIILLSALISNLFFISQILYKKFNGNSTSV